jgi:hypothetical protein
MDSDYDHPVLKAAGWLLAAFGVVAVGWMIVLAAVGLMLAPIMRLLAASAGDQPVVLLLAAVAFAAVSHFIPNFVLLAATARWSQLNRSVLWVLLAEAALRFLSVFGPAVSLPVLGFGSYFLIDFRAAPAWALSLVTLVGAVSSLLGIWYYARVRERLRRRLPVPVPASTAPVRDDAPCAAPDPLEPAEA